jgi:1-acyl-sn-glycerol-3-phosphate acyltransferase
LTNEEAHRLAREKGVSRPTYWVVRAIVVPFVRFWFRLRVTGREHVPTEGAAIVAPNHKSFFDSFFIAVCTRRHLRFMGKSELFEGRRGRLLIALGAFPVRRGQSDVDAIETAREILRQGGLLALFPEGTRVRDPDELGDPKKGAGRLALEMGTPLVPCAISGTEKLFAGPFPKPRRVQVAFAAPIEVKELAATPEEAGDVVENMLWPEVEREFHGLRAHPGLIAAGAAALGFAAWRVRKRR